MCPANAALALRVLKKELAKRADFFVPQLGEALVATSDFHQHLLPPDPYAAPASPSGPRPRPTTGGDPSLDGLATMYSVIVQEVSS